MKVCRRCNKEKVDFAFEKNTGVCKRCKTMQVVRNSDKLRMKQSLGLSRLNSNSDKIKIFSKYIKPVKKVPYSVVEKFVEGVRYKVIDEETVIYMEFKNRKNEDIITRNNVFERDSYTCVYCQENEAEVIDFITPPSKGGTFNMGNLISSCKECNQIKSDKVFSSLEHARRYINRVKQYNRRVEFNKKLQKFREEQKNKKF